MSNSGLPNKIIPIRPIHGMWTSDQAQDCPEGTSPDMQNMMIFRGMLRKRPGFRFFGNGLPFNGTGVVGVYATKDTQGIQHLFAISGAQTLKHYNPGTGNWDTVAGPALTGTHLDLMSWENALSGIVFSQGVDPVMYCPITAGVPGTYAALSANCPPAKYMTRFADRLYLAYTKESGVAKPFRIRWPTAQLDTDWVGIGAGFRDNLEQPRVITGLRKLQDMMAVYTERTITMAARTGDALAPAQYQLVASDTGSPSGKTVDGRNALHMFMGNDDFYSFNGGVPTPFGGAIRDKFFRDINPGYYDQNWGIFLPETQEYAAFVCEAFEKPPRHIWVFNYARQAFYPWILPIANVSSMKCGTLYVKDVNSPDDTTLPRLITGGGAGQIYEWSTEYLSDAGATPSDPEVAIDAYWTSKDFNATDISPDPRFIRNQITLCRVGIAYADTGVAAELSIDYSIDGGCSFCTDTESISLPSCGSIGSVSDATWWKRITGPRIRVRFRNNTTNENPQIVCFYFDFEIDGQKF